MKGTWKQSYENEIVHQQQIIFNILGGCVCVSADTCERGREGEERVFKQTRLQSLIFFLHNFLDWLLNLVLN